MSSFTTGKSLIHQHDEYLTNQFPAASDPASCPIPAAESSTQETPKVKVCLDFVGFDIGMNSDLSSLVAFVMKRKPHATNACCLQNQTNR